jgi:hypothetical protein
MACHIARFVLRFHSRTPPKEENADPVVNYRGLKVSALYNLPHWHNYHMNNNSRLARDFCDLRLSCRFSSVAVKFIDTASCIILYLK